MNILLVKPASGYPAVGLACIAATVEKDHNIKILDLGIYNESIEDKKKILTDAIDSFKPKIVGMTSVSSYWDTTIKFGSLIKEKYPDIITIYGGPHVSQVPEEAIQNKFIDYIAVGEGETLFRDFVSSVDNNQEVDIPGIMYLKEEKIQYTPWKRYVDDINSLPMPAYNLLDMEKYQDIGERRVPSKYKRRYMTIMTSRGCPFQCFYCHHIFGKQFRYKTVKSVVNELKLLHDNFNITEFHFEDDCFNANKEHAKDLMRGIIDSGLKIHIKFPNGTRADCYDEELVKLMKEAGVFRVILAFETLSPRLQKYIKKYLNLEKSKEAMYWFKKHKIETYGFFMIGFPTETKEELWNTIKFAITSPLSLASFSIVSPSPGTELYYHAIEKGYIEKGKIHASHSKAIMNLENFTAEDLEKIRAKANLLFFMYPPRLAKLLLNIRDTRLLKYYARNFRGKVLRI